jgi:hypothetical protein
MESLSSSSLISARKSLDPGLVFQLLSLLMMDSSSGFAFPCPLFYSQWAAMPYSAVWFMA